MSVSWPDDWIDLTACAALFTAAGHPVDRTNLGRFVASRNFPTRAAGRRKLVDARALFEAFTADFTRRVMAGEETADQATPDPADRPAAAPNAAPPARAPAASDPKRELAALKVQGEQLDLAERLRHVAPVAEIDAALAGAYADLIAAFSEAEADVADELLAALHLPAHTRPAIRVALKRFTRRGREKFAARIAAQMTATGEVEAVARRRLEALAEHAAALSADALTE